MPTAPTPYITLITPNIIPFGSTLTLIVYGNSFDGSSVVFWNATALATVFANSTQLQATITAPLLAAPGTATITVQNTGPLTSNGLVFTVLNGFPESPHPYTKPFSCTQTVPGAPANIWVTFDPQTYAFDGDVTGQRDIIEITNGGAFTQHYTGAQLSGVTIEIPGDTYTISFSAIKYGGNFFGFRVIDVRTTTPPATGFYRLGNRNGDDEYNSVATIREFSPPVGPLAAVHPSYSGSGTPVISPQILPEVTVNQPYGYQFTFPNAVGSIIWSTSAGSLPTGITLNPATAVGMVTIADGGTNYAVGDTGFIVLGKDITNDYILGALLAKYTVTSVDGSNVVTGLTISYGGAGYALSFAQLTIPGYEQPGAGGGLTLNITGLVAARGVIGGTAPATPISKTFTLMAIDSLANVAEGQFTLDVFSNPAVIADVVRGGSPDVEAMSTDNVDSEWFFKWNSDLYAVLFTVDSSGILTYRPLLKKSVDGGTTWTVVNTGDTTSLAQAQMGFYQKAGAIYYLFPIDGFTVMSYDILTNAYATLFTLVPAIQLSSIIRIFVKPDNSVVVFGLLGSVGSVQLVMVTSGGTVATTVSTNNTSGAADVLNSGTQFSIKMDATGAFHVFYAIQSTFRPVVNIAGTAVTWVSGPKFYNPGMVGGIFDAPTLNTCTVYIDDEHVTLNNPQTGTGVTATFQQTYYYYVRVAADGTVGTPIQLDANYFNNLPLHEAGADNPKLTQIGHGFIRTEQNEIIVPFAFGLSQNGAQNNSIMGVLRGSPLSAPVFTTELVDCPINRDQSNFTYFGYFAYGMYAVEGSDGSDVIFWTGFDQYLSDSDYGAIWQTVNPRDGSGWSYRNRYYSSLAVPMYAPVVGSDQFTFLQRAIADATAPTGFRLAFDGNPGDNGTANIANSLMVLASPAVPPDTASIVCSITILGPNKVSGFWALINGYMIKEDGTN